MSSKHSSIRTTKGVVPLGDADNAVIVGGIQYVFVPISSTKEHSATTCAMCALPSHCDSIKCKRSQRNDGANGYYIEA